MPTPSWCRILRRAEEGTESYGESGPKVTISNYQTIVAHCLEWLTSGLGLLSVHIEWALLLDGPVGRHVSPLLQSEWYCLPSHCALVSPAFVITNLFQNAKHGRKHVAISHVAMIYLYYNMRRFRRPSGYTYIATWIGRYIFQSSTLQLRPHQKDTVTILPTAKPTGLVETNSFFLVNQSSKEG